MPRIVFTVSNDLQTDQRMIRICSTLAAQGYDVLLVGVCFKDSGPIPDRSFQQHRLLLKHKVGKRFYIGLNRQLYAFLFDMAAKTNNEQAALCAIDLDTILPVWLVTKRFPHLRRVYDAHEYFTEMTEVIRRPWIKAAWRALEKMVLPSFPMGYTVNETLADLFFKQYGHRYAVIRNLPVLVRNEDSIQKIPDLPTKFIVYQGAVNEGRAFEHLIPAMRDVPVPLLILGDGNYMRQAKELVNKHNMSGKVIFAGRLNPETLATITPQALLGLTLFTDKGHNQFHSLANRFFDYIMAGIPQVCADYPEYRKVNEQWEIASMCADISPEGISGSINKLLADPVLYEFKRKNCLKARLALNWETESKKLISFWNQVFEDNTAQ